MKVYLLSILITLGFYSSVYADDWVFKKKHTETDYIYGDTKITQVIDTTKNTILPDYQLIIY